MRTPVALCSLALLIGCATHRIPEPRLERLAREQVPDTVFIARWPWPEQADSLFRCPKLPGRSTGTASAYLVIWQKGLKEEAARNGLQLVWPETGWSGVTEPWPVRPGPASLVLELDSLVVHPVKDSGLKRLAQWMNLGLEEAREFGWAETHFRLRHGDGFVEGASPVLSRRPDTRYTLNHSDRTGLLLGQAARDLVSLFRARAR